MLVQSFVMAFMARLSGLRAVSQRCGDLLLTRAVSSIAEALSRSSSLDFVRGLVGMLESGHRPASEELVVLDSVALTLPKTQRHKCAKFNNKTVGGGVLWAYMVNATRGVTPLKVLEVIHGAWCDSKVMRDVRLVARGPVYVMDRGFYALELLEQWLSQRVRFVLRVRERSLKYDVLQNLSTPRWIGSQYLMLDAIVRLGGAQAKAHPQVRLIIARLASGENLIVATDRLEWSAERVLHSYKQRWHIERFHRFLKDTLGLSHLYSFGQTGITFLLYTALLTALLLFLAADNPCGETITVLRHMLTAVRSALGLGTPWKRNSCVRSRNKKRPKRKAKTAGR